MAPVWKQVHYGFKVHLVFQTFLTHSLSFSLTLQHLLSAPSHSLSLPLALLLYAVSKLLSSQLVLSLFQQKTICLLQIQRGGLKCSPERGRERQGKRGLQGCREGDEQGENIHELGRQDLLVAFASHALTTQMCLCDQICI